jgi:CMP-N-acetylneuraminic acid synthetase
MNDLITNTDRLMVAFIPARGGSKRLPRKNIRKFAGQPLLYYSIAVAKTLPQISRCIVSTEDEEIAEIAQNLGAEVIERPAELAGDGATTASAARHALGELFRKGCAPDALLTLQPNCPLRPLSLVKQAIDLFDSERPDSVITVTKSAHKLGKINGRFFVPDYHPGIRSQDMEPMYFENGLVYITRTGLIMEKEDLFGERIIPLVTDPLYAMGDIDTELDFHVAEFLFEKYRDHFAY